MYYLLMFLEGLITFISPCHLPMLPLFISYFAAGESNKRRVMINSLGFILGFSVIFITLGGFAGAIGGLLTRYSTAVNIVTGLIVILFGLNYTGIINIGFLHRGFSRKTDVKDLRFLSSVIFGVVFSIGLTPCVGIFLGSALMLTASAGGFFNGILMLALFSLGLGTPYVISALLIDSLKGAFDFLKRNSQIINYASGSLLIIIGILMATGLMERLLVHF